MKNSIYSILSLIVFITGCEQNSYSPNGIVVDNSVNSSVNLFEEAISNRTQTLVFPANTGTVCKLSDDGVEVCLNTDCFELNGNPVNSGDIVLDYVEIFTKGDMVVTNKATTDAATGEMLISGGEFYVQAYIDGSPLSISTNCDWAGLLNIDPNLTGGIDWNMGMWTGDINEDGNLNWNPVVVENILDTLSVVNCDSIEFTDFCSYTLPFSWGWHNCDVFTSWPSPKTTVTVNVPSQYDGSNSITMILFENQQNLGAVNFNYLGTNYFQSVASTVPVGLNAHIIFLVQYTNGDYVYAIESLAIEEDQVINLSIDDLETATESEMVDLINLLP